MEGKHQGRLWTTEYTI